MLFPDQAATMSTPLAKPQIITHIQKSLNYTVFDSKWIPCSARFICLGNFPRGTGVMQIYEVQRGEVQLIKEVTCTTCKVFSLFSFPPIKLSTSRTFMLEIMQE